MHHRKPIAGLQEQGIHDGESAGREAETKGSVAETQKPRKAGQTEADPGSTVTAGPSIRDTDVSKGNSDVVGCDNRDEASHPEKVKDSTMGSEGKENPPKRVEESIDMTSTKKEVVDLTEERGRTKRTVHIYRRRPGREEASVEHTTENRPRGTPEARKERGGEA